MKKIISKILNRVGYDLIETKKDFLFDMDDGFKAIFELCKDYTMTSTERMYSLYKSVEYIVKNNIKGDLVECGVWKGGSAMVIAYTLLKFGVTDRNIYLYDTFEGMSEPTDNDIDFRGKKAKQRLFDTKDKGKLIWCYSTIDEVTKNLHSTNYPKDKLLFIKGKVEDTIPQTIPKIISLLRLDTDWYESTKHELRHLYPVLENNGVLIIDDYGYWKGSRKAVDEYFIEINCPVFLSRIDYTGRIAFKINNKEGTS